MILLKIHSCVLSPVFLTLSQQQFMQIFRIIFLSSSSALSLLLLLICSPESLLQIFFFLYISQVALHFFDASPYFGRYPSTSLAQYLNLDAQSWISFGRSAVGGCPICPPFFKDCL